MHAFCKHCQILCILQTRFRVFLVHLFIFNSVLSKHCAPITSYTVMMRFWTHNYLIDSLGYFQPNVPVKMFYPHPTGTPGDITFLGVAPVSLSLYFCLAPPYINTLITLFSSAPPLSITHVFRLTPGLPRNNLTSALIKKDIILH